MSSKVESYVPSKARAKCIGCGVIVATIRTVHVECMKCEGDRNRATHDRLSSERRPKSKEY